MKFQQTPVTAATTSQIRMTKTLICWQGIAAKTNPT